MDVLWTLAQPEAGFAVGLWRTADEADALADAHSLGQLHEMYAVPIYADGLPDALADQLVELGVAEDVVRGFDGTASSCRRLAEGLLNFADILGHQESEAEAARLRWQMAGRVCAWCGRITTAAGRSAGAPRLACDAHADQLEPDDG